MLQALPSCHRVSTNEVIVWAKLIPQRYQGANSLVP